MPAPQRTTARSALVRTGAQSPRPALERLAGLVAVAGEQWQVGTARCGGVGPSLAEALYERWYTVPDPAPMAVSGDPLVRSRSLVGALRAAHADAGLTDEQWVVSQAGPTGVLTATSGAHTRKLQPGDYVVVGRPGAPAAPGEVVHAVGRLDAVDEERALWWTFTRDGPAAPLGRIYLDVRPATAPRALHEVTAALAEVGANYQLKCPVDPGAFERVDAMVLYHPRAVRDDVLAALGARWEVLGPLLDPAVVPLTSPVAPGLSFADDDGDPTRSFGEVRCQALAAALVAAGTAWSACSTSERVALLAAGLASAGFDPGAPWSAAP